MIKEGSIVKAKAGRDKDDLFVVVGIDGSYQIITRTSTDERGLQNFC